MLLVQVTLVRRCCGETILKLCQEERHPVQNLSQVVHEASLPTNQVQVAISHVARQPGINQSEHSGQDHFLEGGRQLLVLGHDRVVLPHSVADPDPGPDPSDPYVFGPPGSGAISQRYGSGSGYFNHQAKVVRKTP